MENSGKKEELKKRLEKLRSLRNRLCSQNSDWKDGFEARDYIVSEMEDIKKMLESGIVDSKEVLVKINSVLNLLNPNEE